MKSHNVRHKPYRNVTEHEQDLIKKQKEKTEAQNEKPEILDDGKNWKLTEFLK